METQFSAKHITRKKHVPEESGTVGISDILNHYSTQEILDALRRMNRVKNLFGQGSKDHQGNLLKEFAASSVKRSFLVFSHNKYFNIHTENIAYFYVRNEATSIMCFDNQEYSLKYSLQYIQNHLTHLQFFRLNRKYLINFNSVKEVEHFFARKLLVTLAVPCSDKLLVSKEKASNFLRWLENR